LSASDEVSTNRNRADASVTAGSAMPDRFMLCAESGAKQPLIPIHSSH
jgi:hypothetical protein